MTRTARVLAPLALAGLLLAAPAALAQDARTSVSETGHGGSLNISFPGGAMAEFVAAMKAGIPGPFNVLLRREADGLEVPPMDLQMVSIRSAFELAIPQRGAWTEIQPDGTQIDFYRNLEQIGGDDHASAPVFVIDAYERVREADPFKGVRKQEQPRIDVFSLERAVRSDADVNGLLTAIDTALALGEGDRKAEIKFHPDSSLLIVRGSPDQLSTISRVIDRFKESGNTRENEQYERAVMLSELKAELIERRAHMQQAEARLQNSVEEMQQLEALAQKEMVSDREVREAKSHLRINEAEFEAAHARYKAAQEKMAMLSASIDRPEMETRQYQLGNTTAAGTLSAKIFEDIDLISGHIRSVEHTRNDQGRVTLSITADEGGHRVIAMLVDAIRNSSQWIGSSPTTVPSRGGGWAWVREHWGEEYYSSLVPSRRP